MLNKQILITLLLAIGFAQSGFAMDHQIAALEPEERNEQLLSASQKGDADGVQRLLENGADANTCDTNGTTCLMEAAQGGYEFICKQLLQHGARVDALNNAGHTAFSLLTAAMLQPGAHPNPFTMTKKYNLGKALAIHALFNPYRGAQEVHNSKRIMFTALLVFKRMRLCKDVQLLILSNPALEEDACNSGFNISKNQHDIAPYLPLQTVRNLIRNKTLDLDQTVMAIMDHNFKCLIPLLQDAASHAQFAQAQTTLSPENVKEKTSKEMEENIRRRLLNHPLPPKQERGLFGMFRLAGNW